MVVNIIILFADSAGSDHDSLQVLAVLAVLIGPGVLIAVVYGCIKFIGWKRVCHL